MTRYTLGTIAFTLLLAALPGLAVAAPEASEDIPETDWQGMLLTDQGQQDWPSHATVTLDIAHIAEANPMLDGTASDPVWQSVTPQTLQLAPASGSGESRTATLRAYHNGTIFYLFVTWADSTYNDAPQQYVWDAATYRYRLIPAAEDRVTVLFKKYGDFRGDVLTGEGYAADMWRWGAGTTNPSGYADDLWRAVLKSPQEGLDATKVGTGTVARYVSTIPDQGKLGHFLIPMPEKYAGDQFNAEQSQEPVHSAGDVRARGQFTRDDGWAVEAGRHMRTYADDDIELFPNNVYEIAISIVDGATGQKYVSAPIALRLLG